MTIIKMSAETWNATYVANTPPARSPVILTEQQEEASAGRKRAIESIITATDINVVETSCIIMNETSARKQDAPRKVVCRCHARWILRASIMAREHHAR